MPSRPYTEDTARTDRARRIRANKQVQAAEEGTPEDLAAAEQELRGLLDEIGFPRLLVQRVLDALSITKAKWAYCPDCHKKVQVDKADTGAILKAVEMVMAYLLGRPKERKEVDIQVSQKPLHEMSLAELREAAAALRSGD